MIGSFGDIIFSVSRYQALTFDGFSRKGAANYARHELAGAKPVLEFMGPDLSEISFSIYLSVSLGVSPATVIESLNEVKDAGEERQLIIGGKLIGNYVLTEMNENWTTVSSIGALLEAAVNITLLEAAE